MRSKDYIPPIRSTRRRKNQYKTNAIKNFKQFMDKSKFGDPVPDDARCVRCVWFRDGGAGKGTCLWPAKVCMFWGCK